tara:strand:+ start:8 stop:274 length:267 start_codon:yes stop_codon:yes gene_type:complete
MKHAVGYQGMSIYKKTNEQHLQKILKKNTMFKTPLKAVIKTNSKGNVIKVSTPFDNDKVINAPIENVGNENKKTLKSMFKAFGDAYFA